MISFIVIGRNEGWKLTKCLESIYKAIEYNKLTEYEILYIDSNSTDDSIERAKKFDTLKIIKLTSDCNSAIARNIGVLESKGYYLFFIDGDMEIEAEFLKKIYNEKTGLQYNFVSGDYLNIYYNYYGNKISEERYHKNKDIKFQYEVGGLFIIKRDFWDLVGGMRNIFKRSQDIDFALRLASKGVFLCRLPMIAAKHHTINYRSFKRKWKMLFDGSELYSHSLLFRYNILNKFMIRRMLRQDYSMITLILFLFSFILIKNIFFIIPYILVLIVRAYKHCKNLINFIDNFFYYFLRDIIVIGGLFFFFPPKPRNINYEFIAH